MALNPSNSSNLEQLALKGLSGQKPVLCLEVVEVRHCMMKDPRVFVGWEDSCRLWKPTYMYFMMAEYLLRLLWPVHLHPLGCRWWCCMDKLPPSLSVFYTFHYLWYIASSLMQILFDIVYPSIPLSSWLRVTDTNVANAFASHPRVTVVCISVSFLPVSLHLIQIQSSFFFLCLLLTPASFLNHPISALSILCSSFFWGSNILLHTEILIERKLPINRFLFGLLRICFFVFYSSCEHWRCLRNSVSDICFT